MSKPRGTARRIVPVLLVLALSTLLLVSLTDRATTQQFFVHTTYYFSMLALLCWAGTYLHAARGSGWPGVALWVKQNWPGLVVALGVTVVAAFAVEPGLRVLSDEANLVGTSKNLFASKTATFTVSGKYYYGSYWDVDAAIDRRPTLFPFLVSLVHSALGYSYSNVFVFNLLLLPVFLLVAYRLAKDLVGEVFAIIASLFVVAHPITLISVRSGGFDFLALFFSLLVVKSLLDVCRRPRAAQLAIVWMNLCLLAQVRYESALFMAPVLLLLFLFKMLSWSKLEPYAFVYALTPAYLLPRIWQAMLRGNVPEQEPGTVTFSVQNFLDNAHEYFEPVLNPSRAHAHSAILIALGVVGCAMWMGWLAGRVRAKDWKSPESRFGIFVLAWMLLQVVIVFSYVWGRAQYPSAARLVIAIDTFLSFAAAWVLTRALKNFRPFVAVLPAAALLLSQLPVASQHRMLNKLTQTRESAASWEFFERLHEKRIVIVTDRPNHFTIMNYGAMSFEAAKRDRYLFTALERRLFQDIYVIQQIALSTQEPLPGYEIWPDRELVPVHEFQNDADLLVRISRVVH